MVTVPAAFNQMQCEATMRAAKTAGLSNVTLLQEPIAAALSALGTQRRSGQYLIYDLGGGTFDLALVEAIEGQTNVVAHQGINMLGGRDFDRMLVNEIIRPWLVTNFDMPENFQRDKNFQRLIRVAHIAAEKAKIDLSTLEQTTVFASDDEVRLTDLSGTDIFLEAPVTRAQYEALIREPIMQTIDLVRQVLEENNYKHEDIDKLVFIGGPSRTPLIREMVARELGIPTDIKVDPLTSVAIGAAHYATIYHWDGQAPQPAITAGTDKSPAVTTGAANGERPPTPRDVMPEEDAAEGQTKAPHAAKKQSPKRRRRKNPAPEAPVRLDYQTPTSDTETPVYLHIVDILGDVAQIQIESADGWASEIVEITPDVEIRVPVKKLGVNDFTARYFDKRDRMLDQFEQKFSITRSDAVMIPAAQTIAVKALDHLQGQNNILVTIIEKGALLPARGKAQFKSARELAAGARGNLSFELFQVEYPERIELNLCVGVFRVSGSDLPARYVLRAGDPIVFNWKMSDSGILQATVSLPQQSGRAPIELHAPRFYSPQAGEMNFDAEHGGQFAAALLRQAEEERGDLVAAAGPEAGKELSILHMRIGDQQEMLAEDSSDPEAIRKVAEEARLIRQDIARLSKKHRGAVMQRQLGKLTAIFNRLARGHAEKVDIERFESYVDKVQKIIDDGEELALPDAERHFADMRDIFFAAAWRDDQYVRMWFDRLQKEAYLFPDQAEFAKLSTEGKEAKDIKALRKLVSQMLEARIALAASDTTTELATIVRA
ncbi:MAG: Hsp70 family protein [Alphaproteobacteria bacterium]